MSEEPKHVLIAEKNATLAAMVCKGLEEAGFEVSVVEDGREAWDTIEAKHVDLVITGYSMTDSVGTPVCRGIRQHRKYAELPLVVTATAGEVDVDQLRDDLQLLAALRTPFSVKELVASIQAAFGD